MWRRHARRPERTQYAWSGLQMVGERSDSDPDAAVQYVYTENSYEPLARIDSRQQHAEMYWYHTEINGLPEKVTDSHGEIVWRGTSTAWGRSQHESVYAEWDVPQNLRFQGQYLDRETGLHYNTFRYYDPTGGCYTQMDPIGLAGGLNTYTYVVDPLVWVDPLGLMCSPSKGFNRRDRITKRWVDRLTGKKPLDVHDYLTSKGWTATSPQSSNEKAIQHIVYVKKTKAGTTYKLDYHPGGSSSQPNLHGNDYWKVYKVAGNGPDEVLGRIGYGDFKNFDLIKESPVYVDGILMNGG